MRIGRYEIKFGRACWMQTQAPTTVRRFLLFVWIFKEAKPWDLDTSPQFPPGTRLEYEGRTYWYWKVISPVEKKAVKGGDACEGSRAPVPNWVTPEGSPSQYK